MNLDRDAIMEALRELRDGGKQILPLTRLKEGEKADPFTREQHGDLTVLTNMLDQARTYRCSSCDITIGYTVGTAVLSPLVLDDHFQIGISSGTLCRKKHALPPLRDSKGVLIVRYDIGSDTYYEGNQKLSCGGSCIRPWGTSDRHLIRCPMQALAPQKSKAAVMAKNPVTGSTYAPKPQQPKVELDAAQKRLGIRDARYLPFGYNEDVD